MPQVIDRILDDKLNIEVYDDGDCIFTLPGGGFLQVSVDILKRIAKSTKNKANGPSASEERATCTATSDTETPKVPKRITQLLPSEGEPGGWEVVFHPEDSAKTLRQVYTSRGTARDATPETAVGENGRTQ